MKVTFSVYSQSILKGLSRNLVTIIRVSPKASWYHDALNFYPDASVITMMLFQMP